MTQNQSSEVAQKVVRLSSNKKMVLLAPVDGSNEKGTWFFLDERVVKYASNLQPGDQITIKSERKNKDLYIQFLQSVKNGTAEVPLGDGPSRPATRQPFVPYGTKDPATQDSIIKQ